MFPGVLIQDTIAGRLYGTTHTFNQDLTQVPAAAELFLRGVSPKSAQRRLPVVTDFL